MGFSLLASFIPGKPTALPEDYGRPELTRHLYPSLTSSQVDEIVGAVITALTGKTDCISVLVGAVRL